MKRNADFNGDVTLPLSDFLALIDENRRLLQNTKGETKELENRIRAQLTASVASEMDALRAEKKAWDELRRGYAELQQEIVRLKARNLWQRILNR